MSQLNSDRRVSGVMKPEVFPDFAWKLIPGGSMELTFRNDDDMLKALELLRAMRQPTVKDVEESASSLKTSP